MERKRIVALAVPLAVLVFSAGVIVGLEVHLGPGPGASHTLQHGGGMGRLEDLLEGDFRILREFRSLDRARPG